MIPHVDVPEDCTASQNDLDKQHHSHKIRNYPSRLEDIEKRDFRNIRFSYFTHEGLSGLQQRRGEGEPEKSDLQRQRLLPNEMLNSPVPPLNALCWTLTRSLFPSQHC